MIDLDPQSLASRFRQLHGDVTASELARIYGVGISRDAWRVADGRLVYFAECWLKPPKVVLNTEAIESVARAVPGSRWFSESQIAEVVIAHELYHLLTRRSASPEIESSAHEFAQIFTGLPFSPLQYEAVFLRHGLLSRH
jgi:hypothetical protein